MGFDLYRSHKLPSILNSQVADTFSKSEIVPILDFQVVTTAFTEPCKRKAMPWEPDNVSLSLMTIAVHEVALMMVIGQWREG